jgi:hypothetical protein
MNTQTVPCCKIRWFNDACYELQLPNGHGILIDPFIDASENRLLPSSAVEAADYMLVSHTHFDHTMNIGDLSRKFNSQIYVGRDATIELARYYDIPSYRLNPCYPGETYWTDDFRLDCFWAKHIKLNDDDRPSKIEDGAMFAAMGVPRDQMQLNLHGSYEYTNFLLTLKNNFRIMIWGGGVTTDALERVKQYKPDLAIVQFPRNTVEDIVRMCTAIGCQVIFPHHHECFTSVMGLDMEECIRTVQQGVKAQAPNTLVVNPQKGKWYSIQTAVTLLE